MPPSMALQDDAVQRDGGPTASTASPFLDKAEQSTPSPQMSAGKSSLDLTDAVISPREPQDARGATMRCGGGLLAAPCGCLHRSQRLTRVQGPR